MLTELTIKEFINKVLSNDPVPGGGSVSALNGALATSLAAMVANLTIYSQEICRSERNNGRSFCAFRRAHPPADNRCRP